MTSTELRRIFQTLTNGKNKYYVYALCRGDNVPFYIGKGTGERVLQHLEDADAYMATLNDCEEIPKQASEKIKRLIREGNNVRCVIIKWGLSEKEAFMCESALINLLKFTAGQTLEELTNIANGHASKAEEESVADVATKARTLEQFLQECAILERDISALGQYHVAFIKINTLYNQCLNDDGTADREKVKEAARAMWRINRNNAIDYIFALYRQRVVGIFHVTSVSDEVWRVYRQNKCLPNFPTFPERLRQIDVWKARFATLEQAQRELQPREYKDFLAALSERCDDNDTPEDVLNKHRRRVYFNVDDNVPAELAEFNNCIIVNRERPTFFSSQSPVQYN